MTVKTISQLLLFVLVNTLVVYLIFRFAGDSKGIVFILTYGLISILGLLFGQSKQK